VSVSDRVRDLVAPICTDLGLELYDVEHTGGKVRVTVERPGGVDLEALSIATRLISRELDERDPVPGRYQLEVSSPGLERPLRTPVHFRRAVGSTVSIRLQPGAGDERRVGGTLSDADDEGITVQLEGAGALRVPYDDIERARTTFAWGGRPKPGKRPASQTPARRAAAKEET
jgi:ribosome maturation factor RimP